MNQKTLFFIAGLVFLLFVSFNIYLWISVAIDESKPFEQTVKEYMAHYPNFITTGRITVINIVALSLSMFFFYKSSFEQKLRIASIILFIVSGILCAWNIFSLM